MAPIPSQNIETGAHIDGQPAIITNPQASIDRGHRKSVSIARHVTARIDIQIASIVSIASKASIVIQPSYPT